MVRRRLPRVSLGTVYRNLRLLVAEGLVHEMPGPHARFDGNLRSSTTTSRAPAAGGSWTWTAPLRPPPARLSARVAALTGLTITHHRIEFFGRCPGCRPVTGAGAGRIVPRAGDPEVHPDRPPG